jgi:hypothetical protein
MRLIAAPSLPSRSHPCRHSRSARLARLHAEGFRAHVEFLSDDLLERPRHRHARLRIAAHYVATRFESLGLQPGAGRVYQQVPFGALANQLGTRRRA